MNEKYEDFLYVFHSTKAQRSNLENIINKAFDDRDKINANTSGEIRDAVDNTLNQLDNGIILGIKDIDVFLKSKKIEKDKFLILDLLTWMHEKKADYTNKMKRVTQYNFAKNIDR